MSRSKRRIFRTSRKGWDSSTWIIHELRATKSNIYKVRIYYSIVSLSLFVFYSTELFGTLQISNITLLTIARLTKLVRWGAQSQNRTLDERRERSESSSIHSHSIFVFIVNFVCAWATCTVLVLNSLLLLFFIRAKLFFLTFSSVHFHSTTAAAALDTHIFHPPFFLARLITQSREFFSTRQLVE